MDWDREPLARTVLAKPQSDPKECSQKSCPGYWSVGSLKESRGHAFNPFTVQNKKTETKSEEVVSRSLCG